MYEAFILLEQVENEFLVLYSNKRLFTRVHNFANSRGQDAFAIQITRECIEDYQSENLNTTELADDYFEMSKAYLELLRDNPEFAANFYQMQQNHFLGTGLGNNILVELIKEAIQEVIGSALGATDITELRQLIDRYGWDSMGKGAFKIIWRFAKKKAPWLAAWDVIVKSKDVYYKAKSAYNVLDKLSEIPVDKLNKLVQIIQSRAGKLLGKVNMDTYGNGDLKIPRSNAESFFLEFITSIGSTATQFPAQNGGVGYVCNINGFRITFYPQSSTGQVPSIQFEKVDVRGNRITLCKLRFVD